MVATAGGLRFVRFVQIATLKTSAAILMHHEVEKAAHPSQD